MSTTPPVTPDSLRLLASQLAAQRAAILNGAAIDAATADSARATAQQAAAVADTAAYESALAAEQADRASRRAALTGLGALDGQLANQIAQLIGDPCDLEPDVPLVLLPVRLETRYSPDGTQLQVRLYPDDVHIDRLDRGMSDAEHAAGTAYWTAVWAATVSEEAAWSALATAVHPNRAAWVAAALSPDPSLRPSPPGPTPAPVPVSPVPGPRQQRPAVARALPDRFVVTVTQTNAATREVLTASAVGNPVPAELVVGLPTDADPAQLVTQGEVRLGPGMEWLVDPGEARRVGMLVDVTLPLPGGAVSEVLAVGVRISLDPAGGATELADLLTAHRYASGVEFLEPGTPTNNTETDRAAWTAHPRPVPPSTVGASPPTAGSNALVSAVALGLDAALLGDWPGSTGTGQPLAAAAQLSLWQAAWGTFIDRLLISAPSGPSIPDVIREAWRDYWQDWVRGRGPLPTIRIADQPYGVLPVSAVLSAWQPTSADPFEPHLLALLRSAHSVVAGGLVNVPVLGDAGPLDATLLEILGSAPNSIGLRVRSVASSTLVSYTGTAFGIDGIDQPSQDALDAMLWQQLGFAPGSTGLGGALGKTTRPLGLPLVDDSDAAFLEALLNDRGRTVASVLQALLELSFARESSAVSAAAPPAAPRALVERAQPLLGDLSGRIETLTAAAEKGAAPARELHAGADALGRFGVVGPSALAGLQPLAAARTSLADVALSPALPASIAPQQSASALGAWFRAQARLADFRVAATALVTATTPDRRIAVAETLDCASHRFDAWVSALPSARLAQLRAGTPAGVLLGAYGWVENLSPGASLTRPGGYVHAPTLTHAVTAGVLRSAYLTHNPDSTGSGALSIDLTSARVSVARDLLDGVRQGQPLAALLGYLVERRLHEQQADRFVLTLRALAPLLAGRLTDRAGSPPQSARESLAANNVVDGLALLALPRPQVLAALANPPADNPYLPPGSWPPPTPQETAAVNQALDDAAAAQDAASDLLLTEAVHQLVQGNTARAAAVADAAAGGDAPVDPDVLRIPTRAATLTNRLMILLPSPPPGTGGWSAATPRAAAEPRLAAWAEARLGPANAIVVHVATDGTRTTLDSAGLSALDLVHDAADPQTLAARLQAALPAIGTGPLPVASDPGWPPGLRSIGEVAAVAAALLRVITGARPLTAGGLARPNDQPARSVDPADLADLASRVQAAAAGLGVATAALQAAIDASPPAPDAVTAALNGLRGYGISLPPGLPGSERATLAEANRRHQQAVTLQTPAGPVDTALAQAVAEAVFGAGFLILTPVSAGPADLYTGAFGALNPGQAQVRRWLRDAASVRPAVARYTTLLLLADAGVAAPGAAGVSLGVAQLAALGTAGTSGWLGRGLPAGAASPGGPVTNLVLEVPAGYRATNPIAGLVIDEWDEQFPRRNPDGTATMTTGLAVNTTAPGARAPQALLLALSPDGARWTTAGLLEVLRSTRELAQLRAVSLERTTLVGRILPALQEQSWSLQGEETLDLQTLATSLSDVSNFLSYVIESTS